MTEVVARLRRPPQALFHEPRARANYVRFRLGPDIAIALGTRVKRGGKSMRGKAAELSAAKVSDTELLPYQRLIGDAAIGDQELFTREDAVEAAWKIVAPLLSITEQPIPYEPGSWGPAQADALTESIGGWNDPDPAPAP
jgi:glucose-6-phosphate 1-dehydrogenase